MADRRSRVWEEKWSSFREDVLIFRLWIASLRFKGDRPASLVELERSMNTETGYRSPLSAFLLAWIHGFFYENQAKCQEILTQQLDKFPYVWSELSPLPPPIFRLFLELINSLSVTNNNATERLRCSSLHLHMFSAQKGKSTNRSKPYASPITMPLMSAFLSRSIWTDFLTFHPLQCKWSDWRVPVKDHLWDWNQLLSAARLEYCSREPPKICHFNQEWSLSSLLFLSGWLLSLDAR